MKPGSWLLWLTLAASSLPGQVPKNVSALLPAYTKAVHAYALRQQEARDGEADALPRVKAVRELKEKPPGWLRDWQLSRKLAQLQESLDRVTQARSALGMARQDLFLQLSALEEEMRTALEGELAGSHPDSQNIRAWFQAKDAWDRALEELGAGEAKPFDLVEVPSQATSLQMAQDQKKALEARGIQLEAWTEMLASDLRLWKRVGAGNYIPKARVSARIAELEGLSRRVAGMMRKNEALRLANGPQKK